jgi:hypothetical protein
VFGQGERVNAKVFLAVGKRIVRLGQAARLEFAANPAHARFLRFPPL